MVGFRNGRRNRGAQLLCFSTLLAKQKEENIVWKVPFKRFLIAAVRVSKGSLKFWLSRRGAQSRD